jgi:CHAT domain-containing protein
VRRALGDPPGEAETLTALARMERALGRLDPARAHVDEALGLIESLRVRVTDPDLRATYLATQQRAFELAIDLERQLALRAPGTRHAETALALAERARARSLLELLQEARTEVRQGIDPALRERERAVADRLSAAAERQAELAGSSSAERKAAAERDLGDLLAESARVAEEVRRSSPRYAALTQPRPLAAADIRALLDPDTLLLEYRLGEERSFLWAVTAGAVELHELPRRAAIEALARRAYAELSTAERGARSERGAARELGRIVLGPVAGRLAQRRLAIVADGALQYIPFAALPEPGRPGSFLIERHEIVALPSASVLAVERAGPLAGRPAPAAHAALAVLADPVFSVRDPRVHTAPPAVGTGGGPAPKGAVRRGPGGAGFSRLAATRREAAAITALLPRTEVELLLGFAARRGTVVAGELDRYRILHFATHGVIDAERPRLSGLVLSLVDPAGRPQDGFLSLADIYNLDLTADLVVLSGCETALGREIRGEGLIGLVRGFLYAGSRRVVASLWRVEDRATAELMARFYRALLRGGEPPAAALRDAQLALLRQPRWRQPASWAGFVVQGDWRRAAGETSRAPMAGSRQRGTAEPNQEGACTASKTSSAAAASSGSSASSTRRTTPTRWQASSPSPATPTTR